MAAPSPVPSSSSNPLTSFTHIGRLPASFLALRRSMRPSAMLAVVPRHHLDSIAVAHGERALVSHRIATVFAFESLFDRPASTAPRPADSNGNDIDDDDDDDDEGQDKNGHIYSLFPSVALLSACLYDAVTATAASADEPDLTPPTSLSLTVRPLGEHHSTLTSVALIPVLPTPFPAALTHRATVLAKQALIGRDARRGDLIPASATLWLRVSGTTPATHPDQQRSATISDHACAIAALVSSSTRIILHRGHEPCYIPAPLASRVTHAWAARKWLPAPRWENDTAVATMRSALDAHPALLLIEGMHTDLDDVLPHALLARPSILVEQPTAQAVTEAVARAELAAGAPVVVLHVAAEKKATLPDDVVDAVLHVVARRRHHALAHYGRDAPIRVCVAVTCEKKEDLPAALLRAVAPQCVSVPPADRSERVALLQDAAPRLTPADVDALARMCAGYARGHVCGLGRVYGRGGMQACRDAVAFFEGSRATVDAGGTTWGDVGGLEDAKRRILELVGDVGTGGAGREKGEEDGVEADETRPKPRARRATKSKRRVGVLLYGPPGTGKTLLARAVAGECDASFIAVNGPQLLNMYIGESERNVREVFERAAASAPCVIFFDEIDALAPSRGSGSDSGGVSDRVVSQMLSELDGVAGRADVFVIAASNRPDLVDASLLRPGRLDRLVYVPMPASRGAQAQILRAQMRRFTFDGDVDLLEVVRAGPEPGTVSGADLRSLASSAWMKAAERVVERRVRDRDADTGADTGANTQLTSCARKVRRHVKRLARAEREYCQAGTGRVWDAGGARIEGKEEPSGEGSSDEGSSDEGGQSTHVKVRQADLVEAARELKPSLNREQLEEYELLRRRLEGEAR